VRYHVHPALHFQVQIERWKDKFSRSTDSGRKTYCQNILSELNQDDAQFQKVREAFRNYGLGMVLKSWKNWCVIIKDYDPPTFYRFQVFNESGLVAHCVRQSSDAILLEAFQAGFREVDSSNALHRLSRTPKWNRRQVSHVMPLALHSVNQPLQGVFPC